MNKNTITLIFINLLIFIIPAISLGNFHENLSSQIPKTRILKVPADFSTIAEAVAHANDSDWVIISPGTFQENEIEINKSITISSEWKLTGDESKIEETVIDAGDKILFTINADATEISGLKIVNGDHTLNVEANVTIEHNHFINNLDGMSFESGGGGYVGYNTAENDRDDALDLDIVSDDKNSGSDILIEHNVFINCNDDGIEIRLFKPHNQNVHYTIRENRIIGSNNAGVQLISYDEFTGKTFDIHHNIFENCKTGLGCMEGAQTREDLSGATKMDETVYFYNNTVTGCKMGATGGNKIIAFNNLIMGNSLGGFKKFGPNSAIRNNLFYQNGGDDFMEINPKAVQSENIVSTDPRIEPNALSPVANSPCIDAGVQTFEVAGAENPGVSAEYIAGKAPDIGAVEYGRPVQKTSGISLFQVDAGENQVIKSSAASVVLAGRIKSASTEPLTCTWKQEQGLAADIKNPEKLITSVSLPAEGIYRFSINCSNGNPTASDAVTVRYTDNGNGKQLFLNEQETNAVQAQDFAYLYGDAKTRKKNSVRLEPQSMLEYSVGLAGENNFNVWFLVKSKKPGESKLKVEFNQKKTGEIAEIEKAFHWTKLPEKIEATPGQWQLLLKNSSGQVTLRKIVFSTDDNFIPR